MAPVQRRIKINDRRGAASETDLLARLAGAPERGEFSLVYQRQVAPDGVTLVGVETLLRWDCPTKGAMAPEMFIPSRHPADHPLGAGSGHGRDGGV